MLRTESLHFGYNNSSEFNFPDISLANGENLLILGESGIGKTTLLHLLAGLLRPKSGNIFVKERLLSELSSQQMDRFRGRHIGIIFQRPHFIQSISLYRNMALVQHLGGRSADPDWISQVLERLGLENKKSQKPNRLSQGEQQRAAIALSIMNNPEVLLADEPTSSLDDRNCQRVIDLLKEQARYMGTTLVIITHDQRLKADFKNVITL